MTRPVAPPVENTGVPTVVKALEAGVVRPGGRRGKVPGMAILTHPKRNELNALLFVERLPLRAVAAYAEREWGLRVSVEVLSRYVTYLNECIANEVVPVGGHTQVVVERLEKTVETNFGFLRTYVEQAAKMLAEGKMGITTREAIQAVAVMNKMLGDRATIDTLADIAQWRDALNAILRIVMEVCTPEQQQRIAGMCLEDPAIRAVTNRGPRDASPFPDDGEPIDVAAAV